MLTKNWYKYLALRLSSGNFGAGVTFTKSSGDTYTTKTPQMDGGFGASSISSSSYRDYLGPAMKFITTSGNGVRLGTGTTPPTYEDYNLSGAVISVSDLSYSAVLTGDSDETGFTYTSVFTITNNGSASIEIGEVGLFGYVYSNSCLVLLEHTVLDEPLIIPAGGIGQLDYTIRMDYPTE